MYLPNMDVIKLLTQPVREEKANGRKVLRFEEVEEKVLLEIPHLSQVCQNCCRLGETQRSFHFMLEAQNRQLALQAASAMMNLFSQRAQGLEAGAADLFRQSLQAAEDEQEDDEDGSICWDDSEDIACWESPEEAPIDRDYIVVEQRRLFDEQPNMAEMFRAMSGEAEEATKNDLPEGCNLLIECPEGLNEGLPEKLQDLSAGVIILWVCPGRADAYLKERLSFELDFSCLQVETPKSEYWLKLFERYLEETDCGLADDICAEELFGELARYRKGNLCEADLFHYVDKAVWRAQEQNREFLKKEDFSLDHFMNEEEPVKRLERMIGLTQVKEQVKRVAALRIWEEKRLTENKRMLAAHHHLAFVGEPGTGKSQVAALYSEILAQEGAANGKFVKASRSDLIGEYLGQTAPKIHDLFQRADGGVVFIDEAGCLTRQEQYTQEAVTELVRYMEERPQTTVIFATYPEEMERLFAMDPGLRSRISKVIHFPSYSPEELWQIFEGMVEERGFVLQGEVKSALTAYLQRLKKCRGAAFGNAREVRRVMETAIEIHALHCMEETWDKVRDVAEVLTGAEVLEALKELAPLEKPKDRPIGFKPQEQKKVLSASKVSV
ncbi:MAG: AAA family ATPase [Lachnospiraceae bacterium]|nr:AAA family ATPase [Lachnospiraceae bacterium]